MLSVLSRASLCYLATSEEDAPHLCLMSFSFLRDDEEAEAAGGGGEASGSGVFILATRRATKKFAALERNPRCALLVHDFATLREGAAAAGGGGAAAGTVSVTVYGDVEVAAEGSARAARLRGCAA